MTLLYYDPRFLDHRTGHHPEQPQRLQHVFAHLEGTYLAAACDRPNWSPVSRERLLRIHTPEHVDFVAAVAKRGGGNLDPDTVVCSDSFDVALLAVGAVCDAVDRVLAGEDQTALCLVRPPGHHALSHHAMGFCLFNNIAVAARLATTEHGLDRVLIVDWDIHHGNGTQDSFYADGRVGYLSMHRDPFFPGTGKADETGMGDGLGMTRNLPTRFGTPRAEYNRRFRHALEEFADHVRPQLVLVSAGFDTHRQDPIGSLGLETEDFIGMTDEVMAVAATHAEGRLISVLEGGYNPPVLADCVATHLRGLLGQDDECFGIGRFAL
jgi:acetoin utilization deacetylase AcuC-like enzyme